MFLFIILLLIDTIYIKKKAIDSYPIDILISIIIMLVFTSKYIVINSIITTLIAIAIYLLIEKLKNIKSKSKKTKKEANYEISIGLYLSITNILFYVLLFAMCEF